MTQYVRRRQLGDTCPGCLKYFSLPQFDPRTDTKLSDPHCKEKGVIRYRDIYCPYKLPDNVKVSYVQLRHRDLCGRSEMHLERAKEAPSLVHPTMKKYYIFSRHETRIDHRYTGYFDLETFNTELHPMCLECAELTQVTSNKSIKEVSSILFSSFIFS